MQNAGYVQHFPRIFCNSTRVMGLLVHSNKLASLTILRMKKANAHFFGFCLFVLGVFCCCCFVCLLLLLFFGGVKEILKFK